MVSRRFLIDHLVYFVIGRLGRSIYVCTIIKSAWVIVSTHGTAVHDYSWTCAELQNI